MAVYRARTLYSFIDPDQVYNDELTCLQGGILFRNRSNNENSNKIYPNPTSGEFTLFYNSKSDSRLQILDATGRILFSFELSAKGNTFRGNISMLENGVYRAMIIEDSGKIIENHQLILQK